MTDPSDLSMSWMVQESLDCFYASIAIAIMLGIRSRSRANRFNVYLPNVLRGLVVDVVRVYVSMLCFGPLLCWLRSSSIFLNPFTFFCTHTFHSFLSEYHHIGIECLSCHAIWCKKRWTNMTDFSFPNRYYSITNLLTGTLAENFPPVS